MFKTILTILDGSPCDVAVVQRAAELASKLDAEVVLVRTTLARAVADLTPAEAQVAAATTAEDGVARLEEQLVREGLRVRSAVAYGSGLEAMVETVTLQGADVVVAAGPSGGSSDAIPELMMALQKARVPILIVPHEGPTPRNGHDATQVKSQRCHNCGAQVASTNLSVDARCSCCGYYLRTCSNCGFYDGMICRMDDPQAAERYRGTSCADFRFREWLPAAQGVPA